MSISELIPLLVIAVMLPVIVLRNRKPRTLHVRWMWVTPLIVVALIGAGLWAMNRFEAGHGVFGPIDWAILALGAALGAAFGWQRGRMVTIEKHADGTLKAQSSPIGIVIIVAVLLLRRLAQPWLEAHADAWHVNPFAILEAFMLFAAAMVVLQRVEMAVRARRIQAGQADAHVETA